MTAEEWLHYPLPGPMLQSLGDQATLRKLRLFAVACCRRIWHLMADERCRRAVEVAERFADGFASRRERKAAELEARAARETAKSHAWQAAQFAVGHSTLQAAVYNIAADVA